MLTGIVLNYVLRILSACERDTNIRVGHKASQEICYL